ncbi:hypothetical protein [Dethiosulfatarculus sandiegensis]|uniref:hypothetical protein n=1 Tax=Dethiosulfatarculus sandiegensis TaxID=1429043 RepID=UPI0018D0AF12|nr:hypothetical protein [Dethiosulfatarculus sandiegensis]
MQKRIFQILFYGTDMRHRLFAGAGKRQLKEAVREKVTVSLLRSGLILITLKILYTVFENSLSHSYKLCNQPAAYRIFFNNQPISPILALRHLFSVYLCDFAWYFPVKYFQGNHVWKNKRAMQTTQKY